MTRPLAVCAAVLALAAAATPGRAAAQAPLVFGPPTLLALDGDRPAVTLGPAGEAVVAWEGTDAAPGVFAAARPGGTAPFGPAIRLSQEPGYAPQVARADRGDVAVAWSTRPGPGRVAIAGPGGGFGAAEPVPTPPRAPTAPGNENIDDSRSLGITGMALAADGTLAVAIADDDYRAARRRAFVVLRSVTGAWGEPQLLDDRMEAPPVLGADGTGGLLAMWAGRERDDPRAPKAIRVAERGAAAGAFGPARSISEPGVSAFNGVTFPALHVNRAGEALVIHASGDGLFPTAVRAIRRRPGRDWEAPAPAGDGLRPSSALNEAGDAAVVLGAGPELGTAFRPAGGAFGSLEQRPAGRNEVEQLPITLDALGTTVALRRADGRLRAFLRPRAGGLVGPVEVSPAGQTANGAVIVADPLGNGLVAWGAARQGARGIAVANYSARPPQVSALDVVPGAAIFGVDEPARIRLTVADRRGRTASVTAPAARRGRMRIAFSPRMRALVRRPGRYRASVKARDRGPGVSVRRVAFRRR